MTNKFNVRRATVGDVATIARHRAEMFRDMNVLPESLYDELVTASVRYLTAAIPVEEYVGWLVAGRDSPQQIVAGAGVQQRRVLPHPLRSGDSIVLAGGRQGIVLNVFTE